MIKPDLVWFVNESSFLDGFDSSGERPFLIFFQEANNGCSNLIRRFVGANVPARNDQGAILWNADIVVFADHIERWDR